MMASANPKKRTSCDTSLSGRLARAVLQDTAYSVLTDGPPRFAHMATDRYLGDDEQRLKATASDDHST